MSCDTCKKHGGDCLEGNTYCANNGCMKEKEMMQAAQFETKKGSGNRRERRAEMKPKKRMGGRNR